MALLVVLFHSLPGVPRTAAHPWGMPAWEVPLDALTWCAVPFFFIVSGYYFREGRSLKTAIGTPLKRLIPIYLVWLGLYIAVNRIFWPTLDSKTILQVLPDGGWTAFHLWFLPALALAITVLALSDRAGGQFLVAVVAIATAILGPVLSTYHFLLGIEQLPTWLSHAERQFAAVTFISIGYFIRRTRVPSVKVATVLCIATFVCMLVERAALIYLFNQHEISNAFPLLATFGFGAAVFTLARSLNGYERIARYASWGSISLAIYVCHLFYIRLLQAQLPPLPGRTAVVFLGTALIATFTGMALVRIPWFWRVSTTNPPRSV